MNPYDINAFESSFIPALTNEQGLNVNLPPIERVNIPEIKSPDIDKHVLVQPKPKDVKELFADINKQFEDDKPLYEFTYTQDKDKRYNNPNMRYDPSLNMEKIYEEDQGQLGAFKVQIGSAWNTLHNSLDNLYTGTGRTVTNTVNLEGYDKIKNSFLNTELQENTYLNNLAYMVDNPVYNADPTDDSYFSMRGEFGNLIASSGYTAAGIVSTVQDQVLGSVMKAASVTGVGKAVVAAIGAGALGLTNKNAQALVGEDNANRIIGIVTGATESAAITAGWDKLFKGKDTLKQLAALRESAKAAKQNRNVFKELGNYFDDMVYNVKAGTTLDKASGLSKSILVGNTLSKGGKILSTAGKMYLSAGAEAGVEALDAQAQYLEARIREDKDVVKDEKYYQDLKKNVIDVGQQTYDLNRLLLGATGFTQFSDIVMGSAIRNIAKDAGVEYIGKEFVAKGGIGKALLNTFIKDNVSEGIEEFGQLAISKGTVAHVLDRERGKAKIDSYFDETANLISPEGFKAFMSGMIMGSGISAAKGLYNGSKNLLKGQSFGEGFSGYDKAYSTQVANHLNESAKVFNTILKNSQKLNPTTDIKEQVTKAIFDHASSGIRMGTFDATKQYLDSLFKAEPGSDDHTLLMKAYGSENAIQEAKTEIFTKLDTAKASIKNFTEYFNNPFTLDTIDSLMDKDKQSTKEKKEMFDTLVDTAARVLYLQDNKTQEFKDLVDKVKPAFKTGTYDYSNFFTSNSAGWDTFKAQVSTDLETLDTASRVTPLSVKDKQTKSELEKIQKDIAKFEQEEQDIFDSAKPIQKSDSAQDQMDFLLANMQRDLAIKQANPIFRFIQSKDNSFDLRSLKTIEELQKTNEALAMLTGDLGKLTSKNTQKQFVEHLYEMRKSFVKGAKLEKEKEDNAPVQPTPTQATPQTPTPTQPQVQQSTATTPTQPVVTAPIDDVTALQGFGIECA